MTGRIVIRPYTAIIRIMVNFTHMRDYVANLGDGPNPDIVWWLMAGRILIRPYQRRIATAYPARYARQKEEKQRLRYAQ